MNETKRFIQMFLYFALLSGLGWLCDFGTFTLLVKIAHMPNFIANFISSYVGVTFVWFTSLRTVFKYSGEKHHTFLILYWGFQFFSILVYSQLLQMLAEKIHHTDLFMQFSQNSAIISKILITPFNLITNFIFMKVLTRFMQREKHKNV